MSELIHHDKAFQKQDNVFLNGKNVQSKKSKSGVRYYRKIGLGFRTPKTAIEGDYIDNKCPFTGIPTIRGRIYKGLVISNKMHRTIVIRRDYLHYIRKFKRFEKRHKSLKAHCSPAFRVEPGDVVTVGQCRPLSKCVRFNVVRVEPTKVQGNLKKQFVMF
ncbi:unnamed protein product [Moneuplotes crassus]|uniref:Small ribosomal subunit protein uS17 n=2 Tax=Euplotes crassus TaxID=5936 RepID=A0AAD1XQ14_EUPCR|nr:unnamed protein product [Moneuplotes crassus]|eukprot:CAMPEP_0196999622 /NCGR_PEP_ID=MMETSP1380-20130617/4757_1 /TAXON_ID=5936 /ORGANISM="Euplotes crassus, Strain CT5" /LENGTH=159 /DNA_ID=CAMNT_0042416601 /DNA_START=23 /DNA_END=502 /DNA_ORIENTATION=+